MCGKCEVSILDKEIGFVEIRQWFDAYANAWQNWIPDENRLADLFFKTWVRVDDIQNAVCKWKYLRDNPEYTSADYDAMLSEFAELENREKEIVAEISKLKKLYDVETEENGLLARRREFDAILAGGDFGEVPDGFSETKECIGCETELPRTGKFYGIRSCRPDGLNDGCRICIIKKGRRCDDPLNKSLEAELKKIRKRRKELPFKTCSKCGKTKNKNRMSSYEKSSVCNDCETIKTNRNKGVAVDKELENRKNEINLKNTNSEYAECEDCGIHFRQQTDFFHLHRENLRSSCKGCRSMKHEIASTPELKKRLDELRKQKADELWKQNEEENPVGEERYCPSCDTWKLADANHFMRSKIRKDDYDENCKDCVNEHVKDPENSKIAKYMERERLAKQKIYLEVCKELLTCECRKCRKIKLWLPEIFGWTLTASGTLKVTCLECDEVIDKNELKALFEQGKFKCNACFEIKSIDAFPARNTLYGILSKCIECNRYYNNMQQRFRRRVDRLYNLQNNLSGLLNYCLRRGGYVKDERTHRIVQCSYRDLADRLEKFGLKILDPLVQVDHRVPTSWAINEAEIKLLFHCSNLFLMTKTENKAKDNRPLRVEDLPADLHPGIRAIYDRKIVELEAGSRPINYYVAPII